ncbi:unnamed protein product [Soboliphyme baturini]|uniref:inositol-phosphate phosphatase n=1 Tax=Soboliphyme baturini TaxID=241478 RepID=A0A183IBG5_9BILA|nr:unnamed protein product [Soboliphyme baturini]
MELKCRWVNLGVLMVSLFFVYLFYLVWREGDRISREVTVDLRELIKYCVIAAETASTAIRKTHLSATVWQREKGKTREGANEYVTKADLISNQLIQNIFSRFPGIQVISEEKESLSSEEVASYEENYYELWQRISGIVSGVPSVHHSLADISVWVDPLDATQEYTGIVCCFISDSCLKFKTVFFTGDLNLMVGEAYNAWQGVQRVAKRSRSLQHWQRE